MEKWKNKMNRLLFLHCMLETDRKTISQIVRALVHIGLGLVPVYPGSNIFCLRHYNSLIPQVRRHPTRLQVV